jgi:hypothetical protein
VRGCRDVVWSRDSDEQLKPAVHAIRSANSAIPWRSMNQIEKRLANDVIGRSPPIRRSAQENP